MMNQQNNLPLTGTQQMNHQNNQMNPAMNPNSGHNQQTSFPGTGSAMNQQNHIRPQNPMNNPSGPQNQLMMNQNQAGMAMANQMSPANMNNPIMNNQMFNQQQQTNNMGKSRERVRVFGPFRFEMICRTEIVLRMAPICVHRMSSFLLIRILLLYEQYE